MAFWGTILKPNQKKKVESPEGDILHLSQACLNDPKDGKNYVMAEVSGTSYAVACLEKGKKEHDSFDLFFDPKACSFMNKGASEVHLTGYFEPVDDDEGDEEETPPPKAVDKKVASPKVEPKKVEAAKSSPKVEASKSPKVDQAKVVTPKAAPAKAPVPEDSEDEEDEEGEEEELMEDEEEEEEESEEPPPAKVGEKRKAAAAPESPAKKGKPDKKAEEPKKGEAKKSEAAAGGDEAAYVKKLEAFLKEKGAQTFSDVGSKLPRPAGVAKFKVLCEKYKDKFVVKGDKVELKK